MNIFSGEKKLIESDGENVVLTTHRIIYQSKQWGMSLYQSIMLEHVTSCENKFTSNIYMALLAAFSFCTSLYAGLNNKSDLMGFALMVTIVFLLLFRASLKSVISIASPSLRINIPTKSMKRERVLEFIHKVEIAINEKSTINISESLVV